MQKRYLKLLKKIWKERAIMNPIILMDVKSGHPDLNKLLQKLDDYLYTLYPTEEVFTIDLETLSIRDVQFVIAYLDEQAVGCGAIKEINKDEIELKRFFVRDDYRNQGIAGEILKNLEKKAKNQNYYLMKLETGDQQVEAINFYRKNGYVEIDRFGEYVDCPSSICMEKRL